MKKPPILLEGFDIGYATMSGKIGQTTYHYHTSYEILFMISGRSEFMIRDKTFSVSDGTVIIIPPNTFHQNIYKTDKIERYVINFEPYLVNAAFLNDIDRLCESSVYIPQNPKQLVGLFGDIAQEYRICDKLTPHMLECKLSSLLSYIIRNKPKSSAKSAEITHPVVSKLLKYINNHYNENISISLASQNFSLSRTYLSRLFNEYTGFSFREYLNIIRLQHAKELLENTNASVTEIAYMSGFSDSNYFSSIFKREEGVPPSAYRKEFLSRAN